MNEISPNPCPQAPRPKPAALVILYSGYPIEFSDVRMTSLLHLPPQETLLQATNDAIHAAEVSSGRPPGQLVILGLIVTDPRFYLEVFQDHGTAIPALRESGQLPDLSGWAVPVPGKTASDSLDLSEGAE